MSFINLPSCENKAGESSHKGRKTDDISIYTTSRQNYIDNLPTELLLRILSFLGEKERVHCKKTCKNLNDIITTTPHLWRFKKVVITGCEEEKVKMDQFFDTYSPSIRILDINTGRDAEHYVVIVDMESKTHASSRVSLEFYDYFRRLVFYLKSFRKIE